MFSEGCVMKVLGLLFAILLAGCAKETTVTDDVFADIHEDITELTQQLPAECKTHEITNKITSISTKTYLAEKSCKRDINDCRAEARRWRFRAYGLCLFIAGVALLFVYRKVRKIL